MNHILRPTLLVNKAKCLANLERMQRKTTEAGILFRPHFKTHQSGEIGEWFRQSGVNSIAVSSVTMAIYFASNGWKDITIAFPVNILEIQQINSLASSIHLNLLLESEYVTSFLTKQLSNKVGFFIKIDVGYHRTGIEPLNTNLIDRVLDIAPKSKKLDFKGFLTHAGQTYHARSESEIRQIRDHAVEKLDSLKDHYSKRYPNLLLSYGDTPSCSLPGPLPMIDEVRPGNFIFYDLMQHYIGSCKLEDIAVAVICPVVAVHESRNEAVLYGGAVHLSKEYCMSSDDTRSYGLAVKFNGTGWDCEKQVGHLTTLSQEHGILKMKGKQEMKPGDLVAVLPVHSCLAADLLKQEQLII
jgi:D-serine deaminase-like pyridoxal phosphate-dependent protein